MIPILYESSETAFRTNGIGRLRDCIRCIVAEGRNDIYEIEFEYPLNGVHYEDIKLGRIVAATHDDTEEIQAFDIVYRSRPINKVVTFRGVHISYRLNGITATLSNVTTLGGALARLENGTPSNPFSIETTMPYSTAGNMTSADGIPKTIRDYMGGIEGSVLDTWGGEWEFNNFRAILHRERGKERNTAIRYGVNMTEFNDEEDITSTYTAVIPYWSNSESVKIGDMYSSDYRLYSPREICVPLDVSDKFETEPTTTQLRAAARSYINSNKPYIGNRSITVDFIRLRDTDDYKNISSLENYSLCDFVPVIFPDYNIEEKFKIVKVEWDVLNERYSNMELGNLSLSLSDALGLSK